MRQDSSGPFGSLTYPSFKTSERVFQIILALELKTVR